MIMCVLEGGGGAGREVWSIPPGSWRFRRLMCVCVALLVAAFTTPLAPPGLRPLGFEHANTRGQKDRGRDEMRGHAVSVCVGVCVLLWVDSSVEVFG